MPSIEENQRVWGRDYNWATAGAEWSKSWGGAASQWYTTLWPRIQPLFDGGSILEIAPGFGRWTEYLIPLASAYTGVDLSEQCIARCRERFRHAPGVTFHVNDGLLLPMVPAASIDFVFSFDSLVHVEQDVLDSYVGEVARVLVPGGFAFLHHSNMGEYRRPLQVARRLSERVGPRQQLRTRLEKVGVLGWDHWRAASPTAAATRATAAEVGLHCAGQELITWGESKRMIDAISVLAKTSNTTRTVVVPNADFFAAARSAQAAAAVYRGVVA